MSDEFVNTYLDDKYFYGKDKNEDLIKQMELAYLYHKDKEKKEKSEYLEIASLYDEFVSKTADLLKLLNKDEILFLGAYLRLKGLMDKKPSLDFEIINNKYVRNKNVVCFRTQDMWYFDSLNFTPYLGEILVRSPISVDKIDAYIEENMLTYKNVEDEVVDKKVYITEENYYNVPLVNINVIDYYALQSEDLKGIIKECKETLEDIRKEVGRNATRTSASVVSKLTRRKVLGLDEE